MLTKIHGSKAATVTEYGILAGLLGAVAIGTVLYLGLETAETFEVANAGVEAGVARGNGNGPGGGNNGNGNGNGGPGCFADTAGSDAITFANLAAQGKTCVDITTGGADTLNLSAANSPITVNALPRPGASTLTVTGNAQGEIINVAGSNRQLFLNLGTGNASIHIPDYDLADFNFSREEGDFIFHSQDGTVKIDVLGGMGPAYWSATNTTFHFADRTITSLDIYDMVMEMYLNNGSVDGTFRDDIVELRCDLDDSSRYHMMGDGDDTGTYVEGSQRFLGESGSDTVDVSSVWASTDVSFITIVNRDVYMIFPDGNHVGFFNLQENWDAQSGEYHVEQIIFSDTTLDLSEISALWAPLVGPFPAAPSCADQAVPGPAQDHRLGGPTGPIEIWWPYNQG